MLENKKSLGNDDLERVTGGSGYNSGDWTCVVDKDQCFSCGCCVGACAQGAISMGPDGTPCIDNSLCIQCEECVITCPAGCIRLR